MSSVPKQVFKKITPETYLKLGALIVMVVIVAFLSIIRQNQIKNLTALLSDVSVKVTIKSKDYQIDQGRVTGQIDDTTRLNVLKLAAFYQWTKEDPLFDSPDFDPQAVLASVNILSQRQSDYLTITKEKQPLYPTEFLTNLTTVSSLTKDFLTSPSDKKANDLVKAQKNLTDLYLKQADDFISFEKDIANTQAVMLNTATSTDTVLADFSKIAQNASSLELEIDARDKCLLNADTCIRPALSFVKPVVFQESPADANFLSPELVYNLPTDQVDKQELKGPFSSQTSCMGWGDNFTQPGQFFYSFIRQINSNGVSLKVNEIEPATDIYFREISKDVTGAGFKELRDQGIDYTKTSPALPYVCPDSGFLNEISEVRLFLDNMRPIFPKQAKPGFLNNAYQNEEEFFNGKLQSYQQLSNLGDYYGYTYYLISMHDASLPQEIYVLRPQFLARYLMIKRKLGGFDLLINRLSDMLYDLSVYDRVYRSASDQYFKGFVYPFKGNYGLVYLPFSPSVWRSSQGLSYFDFTKVKNAVSPGSGFISYTQASELFPQQTILRWFTTIYPSLKSDLKIMDETKKSQ